MYRLGFILLVCLASIADCQNVSEATLQEIKTDVTKLVDKAKNVHENVVQTIEGDLSNHINNTFESAAKHVNTLETLIPKSCEAVDCNNRGTCLGTKTTYICACSIGFSGKNCEDTICESARDCNGRGICLGTTTTLTCLCNIGYTGKRCETLIR